MSSDKNPKSPTLQDIADAAGVSKMTVSRVLRGTGSISAKTREHIKAMAEDMGYRPNPMVQTLMANVRKRKTETISNLAWVSNQPRASSLPETLQRVEIGARARAQDLGFELSRFEIEDSSSSPKSIRRVMQARGIRGAVIAPMTEPGTLPNFPWQEFAVATVGRSLLEPAVHYTMTHYYHTMQRTLNEVCSRGYRRIGLLIRSPEWEVRADHGTAMVFQHHCLNQGIDPNLAYPSSAEWRESDYLDWYEQFKPDAIISDYGKRYERLEKAGLPLRQIGFATLSWHPTHPFCSGIKQPFEELGAASIDLVVAQIHRNERGVPEKPKAMLMEGEWIEGESLPNLAQ